MFNGSNMKFGVIGLGLFGRSLALELAGMDHDVLALDESEKAVSAVQNEVTKTVIGDAKQEELIRELISPNFDAVIVTMGTSLEASLLCVLHTQKVGVDRIVAKSNGPEHTLILTRLGVDEIIRPEEDMAEQLAEKIGNPRVLDYLQLDRDQRMMEMIVPDPFVGKTLRELNLRGRHGIHVLSVKKQGVGEETFVPSPDEPFEQGDVVWVVGPESALTEVSGDG